jgi:hypothetical protein
MLDLIIFKTLHGKTRGMTGYVYIYLSVCYTYVHCYVALACGNLLSLSSVDKENNFTR